MSHRIPGRRCHQSLVYPYVYMEKRKMAFVGYSCVPMLMGTVRTGGYREGEEAMDASDLPPAEAA
ncbi:hypothetical protein KBTX_04489 [wastewater metagenome]|uniref:Uncharacterized protein n=2 Tax=unclassified sequences TaxID=12908 RepID=A0A5B8RJ62_9ZZZZ|nr:hypothetical protein KBTEX_04489 [uncultured organism]